MNISDINGVNPYNPGIKYPAMVSSTAARGAGAPASNGTLYEGQLRKVDTWDSSMQNQIESIRREYSEYINADKLDHTVLTRYMNTGSLDEIFEKAFDLYKGIESSGDDEETKKWKFAVLEDVVKVGVLSHTGNLSRWVSVVGEPMMPQSKTKNKESDIPETNNVFQELQKGLMQNTDQQALNFLDPTQMQQLIRYADVVNMLNHDEGEGELIDLRSLENSEMNSLIERMTQGRFDNPDDKKNTLLKDLDRTQTGEGMSWDAFLDMYMGDPPKDGEDQQLDIGANFAYVAMEMGVANSAKRLTMDFFDFMKANPNASFAELESHLNRNTGNRDLNNLSMSDFAQIGKHIGNMTTGNAQEIANIVNGFDNTIYNKRNDDELNSQWRQNNVSSGIYDRYGQLRRDNIWSNLI